MSMKISIRELLPDPANVRLIAGGGAPLPPSPSIADLFLAENQWIKIRPHQGPPAQHQPGIEIVLYERIIADDVTDVDSAFIVYTEQQLAHPTNKLAALTNALDTMRSTLYSERQKRRRAMQELSGTLASSIVRDLIPALIGNRGPHKHHCASCDVIWQHDTSQIRDDANAYDAAHKCPRCGSEVRDVYTGERGANDKCTELQQNQKPRNWRHRLRKFFRKAQRVSS